MRRVNPGKRNKKSRGSIRRSEGIKAGTRRPTRYAAHTKLSVGEHNAEKTNEMIAKAEQEEIELVFCDLEALEVVRREKIPKGIPVFGTHLFTSEKFKADGSTDKFKSRLVAHGNEQDATLYPDRSSPTAQMQSIMTCLTVAACNPQYEVAKIDVKGAFIQTEMSGTSVYVKCVGKLRDKVLKVFPHMQEYVGDDGVLYSVLRKALFGCVQASRLWYLKLSGFLKRVGYTNSEVDPCVFRKVENNMVYILVVYVDDILIIASEDEIKKLHTQCVEEFRWVTLEVGKCHSYLGMQLEFLEGEVRVNMSNYVEKVIESYERALDIRRAPGKKRVFMVSEDKVAVSASEKQLFHTVVAKLLYLAKRARPDILMVVSFLCTRVKAPTLEDMEKLEHLIGYLRGTKLHLMVLKPGRLLQVEAYIDASFATHIDGKSHSGVVVLNGGVGVLFTSRKQKCISKSPTEAELIALSDNVGLVELFREFLSFVLNHNVGIPIVYQDNTSVISLVTIGSGVVRTKHLRARMGLVREAIEQRKLEIKHVPTSDMMADGLTKALEGNSFDFFAADVLGHKSTGGR